MKKRIKSKDMEVGRKVFLAFREAVPDDGVTIGQAIIGAELFIAECFAEVMSRANEEAAGNELKILMVELNENVELMTAVCRAYNRKKEKEGVSDAETQGERREDVSDAEA